MSYTFNNTRFDINQPNKNTTAINDLIQVKDVLCFIKLICFYYVDSPNDVLKKKYYELLLNIPVYYPNSYFSQEYLKLLDLNPLSSYLDNKIDLLHWCHYIESSILVKYGEQSQNYDSWIVTYNKRYENAYNYNDTDNNMHFLYNEYVLYSLILLSLIGIIKYNI
jgi:hypothetical protein